MRRLTAAGAVATAALGTVAAALPPAGAAVTPEPVDGGGAAGHCVVQAATGRDPRTQTTLGCFDTFAEAQTAAAALGAMSSGSTPMGGAMAAAASGSMTLGWHFEHHGGGGTSVVIVGSSCASTWYPSSWWRTNMSSTVVGPSCSGAKHFSLASCNGTVEVASLPWPSANNLIALNDHVGCVRYQ